MMIHIEFTIGERIDNAADQLVDAARVHGSATGTFNDVVLTALASSKGSEIVAAYEAECERRSAEYAASPEGIAAAKERKARIADKQATHDSLVADLPALDFTDDVAVLDWLCAMQGATDHIGVIVAKDEILATFAAAGYRPNVNCDDDFREDDRDNYFRWLVGQALDGLQRVAIHGIIHKFAAEWKARFLREVAP